MKLFFFTIFILCITLTTAEPLTREESLTLTSLRVLALRHPRPRCVPITLLNDVSCLCFIAFAKGVITNSLRRSCRSAFGLPPSALRNHCISFMSDDGRLRPLRAITSTLKTQERCFVERSMMPVPPASDPQVVLIVQKLDVVKAVLDEALDVLSVFVARPSTPARIVVTGENVKAMRLVSYNDINEKRE